MVAHRQERGCGRQHRESSRVDRISGRTNGRRKRTMSGSNSSVVPVSYSCRTKIVLAVLDRQRSGVEATIWWFCHDHDRSGRSAMIGNIGKEWSAQCDLGFTCWHNSLDVWTVNRTRRLLYRHWVDACRSVSCYFFQHYNCRSCTGGTRFGQHCLRRCLSTKRCSPPGARLFTGHRGDAIRVQY